MARFSLIAALLSASVLAPPLALAQDKGPSATGQPAAKQAAPAQAPDSSSHDAQAGAPKTGENPSAGQASPDAQKSMPPPEGPAPKM